MIVDLRRDDHRSERDNSWGRRHFSSKPDAVVTQASEAVQSSSTELSTIATLPESAVEAAAVLGNWPADYAIRLLEFLHQTSGLPYWETIIASTLVLRLILFPMVINTARGAARMTLMRPEMDALMEKAKANPNDKAMQSRYVVIIIAAHTIHATCHEDKQWHKSCSRGRGVFRRHASMCLSSHSGCPIHTDISWPRC